MYALFTLLPLIATSARADADTPAVNPCAPADAKTSASQTVTVRAWGLFEKKKYAELVELAETCLPEWKPVAEQQQKAILASNETCPPDGAVSAKVRKAIHANGLLNDVTSLYWMLGKSYAAESKKAKSRAALETCATLTCGRTWDPKGWFWSPSEDCKRELRK